VNYFLQAALVIKATGYQDLQAQDNLNARFIFIVLKPKEIILK
jgi:hypothetical protein